MTYTIVHDTFQGNNERLEDHLPTVGKLWFRWTTPTGWNTVSPSGLITTFGGSVPAYANAAVPPTPSYDVSAIAAITAGPAPPTRALNLFARRKDSQNYYWAQYLQQAGVNGGNGVFVLYKNVNGVATVIGANPLGVNMPWGAGAHTMRLSVTPNGQKIYFDDVLIESGTDIDAALVPVGYAGIDLVFQNGGADVVTDFLVQAAIGQTWPDAKAQIALLLAGVAIADPAALAILKVYTAPPATIQDLPCFVIYPPRAEVSRGGDNRRKKIYTVRCRLLLKDADLARASELLDAFREATIDAFDNAIVLHGAGILLDQVCEEASAFKYANQNLTGFDCLLRLNLIEAKSFAP